MEVGVIVIVAFLCILYFILGVMTAEMVFEDVLRKFPKKQRPVVRLLTAILWPALLLVGSIVCCLSFVFKEWFD